MTKMAENPHPLGPARTYIAHIREYPTPAVGPEILKRKMQCKGVILFKNCPTITLSHAKLSAYQF